jgi:uncharacterized membrane protein YesL
MQKYKLKFKNSNLFFAFFFLLFALFKPATSNRAQDM